MNKPVSINLSHIIKDIPSLALSISIERSYD